MLAATSGQADQAMITRFVEPTPTKASNVAKKVGFEVGDVDAGFFQLQTLKKIIIVSQSVSVLQSV